MIASKHPAQDKALPLEGASALAYPWSNSLWSLFRSGALLSLCFAFAHSYPISGASCARGISAAWSSDTA